MSRKSSYEPALEFMDEDMEVELIAVPDDAKDAEGRAERVEVLIAKIILLGRQRGRPRRKETDDIAA